MNDAEHLRHLELALASRQAAAIEGGYGAALAEEFVELGQSGRRWTRDATLAAMAGQPPRSDITIEAFELAPLAPDLALATYDLLVTGADGTQARSRRSSIWVRRDGRWQLRFHQGTPSPAGQERIETRQATAADVPALAGVLARAFSNEPMVVWPFVTDDDLEARIRAHFEQLDGCNVDAGWMTITRDGSGVMALIPPGVEEQTRAIDEVSVRGMADLAPDQGRRYERFWKWIDSCHPDEPHWLLDQLAVDPPAQGRGIGRAMLELAIERATADGLPLFLETGTERNVALYRHFGFDVMLDGEAPDGGPRVWFMRRDPGPVRPG